MLKLSSLVIGSEHPDKLSQFYGKFLGKPGFEDGEWRGWEVGGQWVMVGPHDKVKGKNKQPGRILFNFETPEVEKEFERIKATGAKVVQQPYEPEGADGGKVATFADPDENYFQLMSPMPM